jgi:hypothetical protein
VQNRFASEPVLNRQNREKTGEPDGPTGFPVCTIKKKTFWPKRRRFAYFFL